MIHRLPSTGEASIVLISSLSRQLQHQSEIGDSASFSQAKTDTGLEQENDAIEGSCGQRQGWRLAIGLALKLSSAISLTGCFAGALWAIACSHPRVLAQNIVTDGTLGAEQPLTGPIYTIPQGLGQTDDSNTNLFHSFRRFNLSNIEQAIFQSAPNIRNIFARVTGGSPSEINGLIYTQEPNINLYFLNPYGILFGPNAELDVGGTGRGSFIATTVDALVWDGGQFSATQPQGRDSLLTLRGDPGGFLSSIRTPGPITNSGATLRVYNNESLLLVGGNVTLNGGSIEAFGGRVEIGAVSGSGTIPLNSENNILSLGAIPLDVARGDVLLTNAARIDASTGLRPGDGIGSISIQAKSLFLERGAQLDSSTFGQGDAGDVVIQATDSVSLTGTNTAIFNNVEPNGSGDGGNVSIETGSLSLTNGAQIQTLVREAQNDQSAGQGNAGNVSIFASGSVEIAGVSSDGLPSAIFSSVGSGVNSNADNTNIGNAGNIEIIAGSVSVSDRGMIESKVNANNTGDAGNIQISAGSVFLDTNAKLNTDNDGSGLAGNILINASSLISIRGNSEVFSQSNNNDLNRGFGSIQITALDGSVLINDSILNTQNASSGFAGDISVTASERVSIENKSRIFSTGIVGQILIGESLYTSISPQVVSIDNSELNTDNSSAFSINTDTDTVAGNILIQATEFISFANGANLTTSTSQKGDAGYVVLQAERVALANSNIQSIVRPEAEGEGGYIGIEARSIDLTNSTLNAATFGAGDAGYVDLQTNGGSVSLDNSTIFTTVEPGATGDGGYIEIKTGSLSLSNSSSLQTLVRGPYDGSAPQGGVGNAGFINVQADRDISITGGGSFSTGIFSTVEPGGKGTAGDIEISARSLYLRDGAGVGVDNLEIGEAGDITITATQDIFLLNKGTITAQTLSGQGGNIYLNVGDFLVLLRDSNISTTAGLAPGGGDGGNMDINARYIFGVPVNDNNITAQAYEGKGGSIRVTTNGLYSIDYRSEDFAETNDITVSSSFGIDGEVEINNLNLDFTQGLTSLPELPVDVSGQITPRCAAVGRDSETVVNKFTITGRGGLPPNPNETLQNESMQTNWVTSDPPVENSNKDDSSGNPHPSVPAESNMPKTPALVEAQGWIYGQKGEVILTAQAPTVTPHNPLLTPAASCNAK